MKMLRAATYRAVVCMKRTDHRMYFISGSRVLWDCRLNMVHIASHRRPLGSLVCKNDPVSKRGSNFLEGLSLGLPGIR